MFCVLTLHEQSCWLHAIIWCFTHLLLAAGAMDAVIFAACSSHKAAFLLRYAGLLPAHAGLASCLSTLPRRVTPLTAAVSFYVYYQAETRRAW